MIALDTNAVIAVLRDRPSPVRERLAAALRRGVPVALPVIVLFELRYGIARSTRRTEAEASLDIFLTLPVAIWPFDPSDAIEAGQIRADLERLGQPIGQYDLMIAAQARRRAASLVTANRREFDRVQGLQVLDWSVP